MKEVSYSSTCVSIRSDGYSEEVNRRPSIMHARILYQLFERSIHHMVITT
jgi:hypothetical protein